MGKKWMKRKPLSKKYIDEVPNIPGVYEILDSRFNTIYAGKSNLRDRLMGGEFKEARYFRVRFMPPKAAEKVENKIIRKKNPKYNLRDW